MWRDGRPAGMDVGVVRVADDQDFAKLKQLVDIHAGWKLEYNKGAAKVWTKPVAGTHFKMIKIRSLFPDVSPIQMYDVLHDPEYRKVWDQHMIESHDIGCLNPNNDIGYYAMSCPAPLKNRDFVLQRSWLDTGQEQYIINHSVYHRDFPPRRGLIRATSFLTGFLVRSAGEGGCDLGYVSQTDPQGTLPPWIVNRITQIFAPKMVKKLLKASRGYPGWKQQNNPNWKPWHFPEQITMPRISVQDCVKSAAEKSVHYADETGIDDSSVVTYLNDADDSD
ncbi:START domain-containing protein 10-like isoform X1 [Bacillus rossius redtenbacheri]|uniref:START domain-containing protein 10-like isoform X1 n=1 Tax=Bacillus rossius redtenbacheri TaxID=93214 RepID=UPI002FDE8CA8